MLIGSVQARHGLVCGLAVAYLTDWGWPSGGLSRRSWPVLTWRLGGYSYCAYLQYGFLNTRYLVLLSA